MFEPVGYSEVNKAADEPDLSRSHGCLVQARAARSFSASVAMEAFRNLDQAKFHSTAPPAAMALQYTVERRLAWILKRDHNDNTNLNQRALREERRNTCTDSRVDVGPHPVLEPLGDKSLTFFQAGPARQADGVHLVIPAGGAKVNSGPETNTCAARTAQLVEQKPRNPSFVY